MEALQKKKNTGSEPYPARPDSLTRQIPSSVQAMHNDAPVSAILATRPRADTTSMRRTLFPALLLAVLLPLPAQARVVVEATSNSNLGPLLAVKISEEIAPGDYEALMQGIRANPGKHG